MNNTVRTSIPVAPDRERATPELNGRLSSMDCSLDAAACVVCSMPIAAGVLHYIAAPGMAVVTQQVGAGVLNVCGANVPTEGVELARNGALDIRPVTAALVVAGQCCCAVARDSSGSNGSSCESSCCAPAVFAAANPAWGIYINHTVHLTSE